jgi:hypothetical protein
MKTVHGYDDSEKVLTWEQWDAATTEQRAGFLAEGYMIKQTREQEARTKRELEMFGCELAAFKASIEQSTTFKDSRGTDDCHVDDVRCAGTNCARQQRGSAADPESCEMDFVRILHEKGLTKSADLL